MITIPKLLGVAPLLCGCAATVAEPPPPPPEAAPRTVYVHALVLDAPPEARDGIAARGLCDVEFDPRVTVLAAPRVGALEGHDATVEFGPANAPPALRFAVHPEPFDGSRMLFDVAVAWEGATSHFRAPLASRETTVREMEGPGPSGRPLLLLLRPVVATREEVKNPAKARSLLEEAMCKAEWTSAARRLDLGEKNQ
jgi:hypothetical protein